MSVQVDVDEDGGGLVTVVVAMDVAAAARTVWSEGSLPLADLTETGWTVNGPVRQPDGGAVITVTKPFSQPDQLAGVLAEVAGPRGPLRDFQLQRSQSFASERWELNGTVDLRGQLDFLSDPELTALLGGYPLGYPPEVIQQLLAGQPLESVVGVRFTATMPGDLGSTSGTVIEQPPATTTSAVGSDPAATASTAPEPRDVVVWNPTFADANPTNVRVESSESQLVPRLWRWLGILALVVGACVLAYQVGFGLLERRRERRRVARRLAHRPVPAYTQLEPEPEPDVAVPAVPGGAAGLGTPAGFGAPGEPAPSLGEAAPVSGLGDTRPVPLVEPRPVAPSTNGSPNRPAPAAKAARGLQLLVIETSGVLFASADPVTDLLAPYARARGSTQATSQINDWYVARIVGGLPAADFWLGLGVPGDAVLLDDGYARRYELAPDIIDFLHQARDRGLEVVAVGEEVPEWVQVFRQRFGLDDVIGAWVSGADVGVRPPHAALLQAVARMTGTPPHSTMVIGRSIAMLDLARRRGSRTVQYAPDLDLPTGDHPVLRSFASVEA